MEATDLSEIRRARELSALRIVAIVRLGVAAVMIVAAHVGLRPKWPAYGPVPWLYAAMAIYAAVVLFGPKSRDLDLSWRQLVLVVLDVGMVITFKLVCPDGAYVPLLALTLLPVMVVLDVSWQRATVALPIIAATFTFEIFTDPVMQEQIGYGRIALASVVFIFLCCTVWLAVFAQSRQLEEIAELSASRQALLADIMNASDEQRRTISEFIHDGPLQTVLMARQDISSVLKKNPDDESLQRAIAGLKEATTQMREATFELHPAVLAGAGLTRALTQIADATSARSGIDISTDIDDTGSDATDPIVFSAARELLSNVVRHSRATRATLRLKVVGGVRHLDVIDDGVGMTRQQALDRLTQGHIGLASQRARIEAAGGSVSILPVQQGTHVSVTVPMVLT